MAILHPCGRPGCPELLPRGKPYCPAHTTKRKRDGPRPYDKRRWRGSENTVGVRDAKLRQDPLCERCLPRTVAAEQVHHRNHDPTDNRRANLESLCRPCHTREHHVDRGGS